MRPTSVFITGGAGFIGSHLAESLVKSGWRVTVYDNFSSGLRENLSPVASDLNLIEGDILDVPNLEAAMRGHEYVSHQAAQLEITKCVDDPVSDLTTNTVGTLNVLSAAARQGVRKLISASSACVYGQAQYIPSDEDKHPTNPNWAYGVSKLATEKYAKIFSELYGFPTVSLRYAIIYGEREWYGRVLTIFLKRLLEGKPPVVFGQGEQKRDFTYVGDLVRLHNQCLTSESADNQILNVSTGVPTTIRGLAELCAEVSGSGLGIEFEDVAIGGRSQHVEGRMRLPAELNEMVLAPDKASRLLGWAPQVDLRQGLKREFEWLRANPGRWKKMSY